VDGRRLALPFVAAAMDSVVDVEVAVTLADDDGSFLMVPKQKVRVRVAAKQAAINTIAQIAKLIGPTILQTNYVTNIGQVMIDADSRRNSLMIEHAARPPIKIIKGPVE